MYKQEVIDALKTRGIIVKVVQYYIKTKLRKPTNKRNPTYSCLCPFHDEKTPSFKIGRPIKKVGNEWKRIKAWSFKCYGCQRSGDVFSFVMHMECCEFPEAFRIVNEIRRNRRFIKKPIENPLQLKLF